VERHRTDIAIQRNEVLRRAAQRALDQARIQSSLPTDIPTTSGWLVYVARDAGGRVLYVGMTGSLWQRMAAHAAKAPWWTQAHSIALIPCRSKRQALRLESQTIAATEPTYNVIGMRYAS
jgi:excinuclease UvrABC nuclease subunit